MADHSRVFVADKSDAVVDVLPNSRKNKSPKGIGVFVFLTNCQADYARVSARWVSLLIYSCIHSNDDKLIFIGIPHHRGIFCTNAIRVHVLNN